MLQKLLTGRLKEFQKLRARDGASGFPQMEESEYDSFAAGHASTAISAALGMARTRDIMHGDNEVVAVVGDGALTGGMCYEALNDAGQTRHAHDRRSERQRDVHLAQRGRDASLSDSAAPEPELPRLQAAPFAAGWSASRALVRPFCAFIERFRDGLREALLLDGKFFSALGFEYIGPIDGHDLKQLIRTLKRSKDMERPALIHVVTQKGKGYRAGGIPSRPCSTAWRRSIPNAARPRQPRSGASCGQIAAARC